MVRQRWSRGDELALPATRVLAATPDGPASLDAWLGFGDPTLESAAFAVALGLITGTAVLVSRLAAHSAVETTTPEAAPDDLAAYTS